MPLYITEFAGRRNARDGVDPFPIQPALAEQTVAVGVASVQSEAFNAGTDLVRVTTDVVCSIKFGTNPTATVATMRLAAGTVDYFTVPAGQAYKVAVISNS